MEATVQRMHSKPIVCEANTPNQLLLVFVVPDDVIVRLGDKLEFPLLQLDVVVPVTNVTRNSSFSTVLKVNNVHDLRIPSGHGTSRTPSPERLAGA
jgi:hypothetical protein